jgi:glycosyltransferase involved in cell wall biosynthesis
MNRSDEAKQSAKDRAKRLVALRNRYLAQYSILSFEPLILFVWIGPDLQLFKNNYGFFFESLKERNVYVVCCTWWHFEYPESVAQLKEMLQQFKIDYPDFRFIFLCNTKSQTELFAGQGLASAYCNSNAFVDEKLFFPVEGIEKRFDAVYDGRAISWKRHALALKIEKLALIYYPDPALSDDAYVKRTIDEFSHACFFNHTDDGAYRNMKPAEINQALNQCRVGLCLSAEEGAMYASIQYLLAGIPVVTTPALGGRDVFFDDENSITVGPTQKEVEDGVKEMIRRNPSSSQIRNKTLERMKIHRTNFFKLIQSIYQDEGIDRDFSAEWNTIFFNKMLRNENYLETIQKINSFR